MAGIALARWAWRDSSPFLGILVCATTGHGRLPHHLGAPPGVGGAVLLWLALAAGPAGRRAGVGRGRRRRPGVGATAAGALGRRQRAPRARLAAAGRAVVLRLLVAFLVGVAVLLAVRRAPGATGRSVAHPPSASAAAAT